MLSLPIKLQIIIDIEEISVLMSFLWPYTSLIFGGHFHSHFMTTGMRKGIVVSEQYQGMASLSYSLPLSFFNAFEGWRGAQEVNECKPEKPGEWKELIQCQVGFRRNKIKARTTSHIQAAHRKNCKLDGRS